MALRGAQVHLDGPTRQAFLGPALPLSSEGQLARSFLSSLCSSADSQTTPPLMGRDLISDLISAVWVCVPLMQPAWGLMRPPSQRSVSIRGFRTFAEFPAVLCSGCLPAFSSCLSLRERRGCVPEWFPLGF